MVLEGPPHARGVAGTHPRLHLITVPVRAYLVLKITMLDWETHGKTSRNKDGPVKSLLSLNESPTFVNVHICPMKFPVVAR